VIDHVGIVVGIDGADPLVHAAARPSILRRQARPRKRLVDIGGNRAGLVDREIAVPQDRNAVERMQRQMLRLAHHGLKVVESVGHVLVSQHKSDDVDKRASRETIALDRIAVGGCFSARTPVF
jgi:hypothetical protein